MDFDAIVLLFAGAWALLSWLVRGVRQAQGRRPEAEADSEAAEREVRRRQRLERLRARREARRPAPSPPPGEDVAEEMRRELERLLGVRTGPAGRQGDVELPPAEEVEELEVLEEEPDVVSLETTGQRAERVVVDYDEAADALARRRVAEAEARAQALTRADHARFDQRIRSEPALTPPPARTPWIRGRRPGGTIRDAIIWAEVLGRPVSERSSFRTGDDSY